MRRQHQDAKVAMQNTVTAWAQQLYKPNNTGISWLGGEKQEK